MRASPTPRSPFSSITSAAAALAQLETQPRCRRCRSSIPQPPNPASPLAAHPAKQIPSTPATPTHPIQSAPIPPAPPSANPRGSPGEDPACAAPPRPRRLEQGAPGPGRAPPMCSPTRRARAGGGQPLLSSPRVLLTLKATPPPALLQSRPTGPPACGRCPTCCCRASNRSKTPPLPRLPNLRLLPRPRVQSGEVGQGRWFNAAVHMVVPTVRPIMEKQGELGMVGAPSRWCRVLEYSRVLCNSIYHSCTIWWWPVEVCDV